MQRYLLPAFALLLVSSGCDGCDKKDGPTTTAPSASASGMASAAPSASAMMASDAAAMSDAAMTDLVDGGPATTTGHMANCPSAAPGATVVLKDVEGGIELSITGKDDASAKDIKARMVKLVDADKNEADSGVHHDHSGSGGGRFGHCTIVMRNTKLTTADLPSGVKATVKANDKAEVDWLRRETRERDANAKLAGAEGAGVHHMAHCPSAVAGAKTAVKDSKDGVVVTVTGPAEAVKDIRDRAKHASDISKLPEPPKVEHNSNGNGGGGMGHCPVIVEGDTIVDTKDVEGGSEITVKAKKDVAALQKEAKLRAASFTGK